MRHYSELIQLDVPGTVCGRVTEDLERGVGLEVLHINTFPASSEVVQRHQDSPPSPLKGELCVVAGGEHLKHWDTV